MAFVIADRVRESTTTTGTGTVTLAGAVSGFQSFSAGIGNGNSTYYTISNNITNQWEVGIGTYTSAGSTLSRTTVLSSSNAGSLVNFSSGTADVFVTYPSERAVYVNSANTSVTVPALSASSITNTGLTSGRVTYASTGGLLADSANLTWSGTALSVTGTVAVTGALTATLDSTFSSTGALLISKGTTGQQPGTPVTGMLRYNTTTNQFEGYSGSSAAWNPVGGASLSNDTSTSSNVYPLFANATSGTATTLYTGNAKLLYKPSTGEFQASVPVALNGLFVNATTLVSSYTIASGQSAQSVGGTSGFTIPSGLSVTLSSGSRWVVL